MMTMMIMTLTSWLIVRWPRPHEEKARVTPSPVAAASSSKQPPPAAAAVAASRRPCVVRFPIAPQVRSSPRQGRPLLLRGDLICCQSAQRGAGGVTLRPDGVPASSDLSAL
eukprot:TRINITY_DN13688_c0_g2_i3.p1 TRINITY_DN13688_c0_g2~~TRINITY_DN13688_c0_g2_i3.p1  ORF type:complete len:111 (-),score=4.28 TRINITY_DN13688_c0_g2_i3:39-371(-)